MEASEELLDTLRTVSLEHGDSSKKCAEDLHSMLRMTFETSNGEKSSERLATIINEQMESWSFKDFQPDRSSAKAASKADLRRKAMTLYINQIPRDMTDDNFCARQILDCYRCIAAGNIPEPLEDIERNTFWRIVKASQDQSSAEKNGKFKSPGLEAYRVWKHVYDKTGVEGQYGLAARQLSCLKVLEKKIQNLEATGKTAGLAHENKRLRKITCNLITEAILYLRDKSGTEDPFNYKNAYKRVASELDTDQVTMLPETWKSALSCLASGDAPTVNEMMTVIGSQPVGTVALSGIV